MGIFSEELRIMDRNTVKYMVDQMQEEIDIQRQKLEQKDNQLNNQQQQIEFLEKELQRLQKNSN